MRRHSDRSQSVADVVITEHGQLHLQPRVTLSLHGKGLAGSGLADVGRRPVQIWTQAERLYRTKRFGTHLAHGIKVVTGRQQAVSG